MHCQACRTYAIEEQIEPACISGACPVGVDNLHPRDLRILEVRGLLVDLNELHLAERICEEYGVTAADLQILAHIERLLKELQPGPDNGDSPDNNPGEK